MKKILITLLTITTVFAGIELNARRGSSAGPFLGGLTTGIFIGKLTDKNYSDCEAYAADLENIIEEKNHTIERLEQKNRTLQRQLNK